MLNFWLILLFYVYRQSICGKFKVETPSACTHWGKTFPMYIRRVRQTIFIRFQPQVCTTLITSFIFFENSFEFKNISLSLSHTNLMLFLTLIGLTVQLVVAMPSALQVVGSNPAQGKCFCD